MTNAIELSHISKRFDSFAIQDLSLCVPSGTICGLVGENGAGKSTTIRLLMGALRPDSGQARVLGVDAASPEFRQAKEDIGVVLDEAYFPESLNALQVGRIMSKTYRRWDGSAYGAFLRRFELPEKKAFKDFSRGFPESLNALQVGRIMSKTYRRWDGSAYGAFLRRFELPEKKAFKDFSRGMRMKLAIAVAMSHSPRLLVLDEATSGLDPIVRDQALELFNDFTRAEDHSILISSHILSDLEKLCDYIAFLHQGQLLFCDEKDQKLAIAVAMSHSPRLLVLDEATSGLDPIVRDQALELFNDFTRAEDHSILISSHILSDLEKLCDYIAFLHQGQLLFCDEKDQLLETYGIFTDSAEQLDCLLPEAIVAREPNGYGGVRALIRRDRAPAGFQLERPTVEDIILFTVKGAKHS